MFKGPQQTVRDNKSSSYPVFELPRVNCTFFYPPDLVTFQIREKRVCKEGRWGRSSSSRPIVFCIEAFLENVTKFTGKHYLFNKVSANFMGIRNVFGKRICVLRKMLHLRCLAEF